MDLLNGVTNWLGRTFNPTSYNQVSKSANVMTKKPNPNQFQTNRFQTKQPATKVKTNDGGSSLYSSISSGFGGSSDKVYDQKILEHIKARPNDLDLYNRFSKETGLDTAMGKRGELNKSINDIESKINNLDTEIGKQTEGFLVTQGARSRLVGAAEVPLRKQYADLALQRREVDADISQKERLAGLLKSSFEGEYGKTGDILRQEKTMNGSGGGGVSDWLSALMDFNKTSNSSASLDTGLSAEELKGLPSKPLSKQGLAGNVTYSTQSGKEVKWSPISNKWVSTSSGNQSKLNKIFKTK